MDGLKIERPCMNAIGQDITLIVIGRQSELVLLVCRNALIIDPKAYILSLGNIFPF